MSNVSKSNDGYCPFNNDVECDKEICTTYCTTWLVSLDIAPEYTIRDVDYNNNGHIIAYNLVNFDAVYDCGNVKEM